MTLSRLLPVAAALAAACLPAPLLAHGNVTCNAGPKEHWKSLDALKAKLAAEGWRATRSQRRACSLQGEAYMTDVTKPGVKPARPYFSSGPCAKPPGWEASKNLAYRIARPLASREDRQGAPRPRIDLMREVLQLPDTHRIGIVPGSDTGAFEMAMWTMLGARGVTTLAWESFGEGWVTDAVKQLKLDPTVTAPIMAAARSRLRSIGRTTCSSPGTAPPPACACPMATGSPRRSRGPVLLRRDQRGVRLRHSVGQDRCDDLLVAEGAGRRGRPRRHDPRPARCRAAGKYTPAWPLPKVFRLVSKGKLAEGVFKGETINTPSMLAVEDAIFALEWAKSVGGLSGLHRAQQRQCGALGQDRRRAQLARPSRRRSGTRSKTSVCLTVDGADEAFIKAIRRCAGKGRRGL
jgi:phosphoserine aminotransferase